MLDTIELKQIIVALEVMQCPTKYNGVTMVPRDYVIKLIKTFTLEVE